jgi:predicted RNA-binding protein Jag
MSNGSSNKSGTPLEVFVREWLEVATTRLGLGFAFELLPMGRSLRVTLKSLEGARFGERRWVQVASAVQTLLETAVVQKGFGHASLEVQIQEAASPDASGELGLVAAVRLAAERAVQGGRAFALGPMSVADRRQVHQALAELPQVWTQSEGEGIFRRLWIIPRQLLPGRSPAKTAPTPDQTAVPAVEEATPSAPEPAEEP